MVTLQAPIELLPRPYIRVWALLPDDRGGNIIRGSFLPDAVPMPAQLPFEGFQEWTGYRLYRDSFQVLEFFIKEKYPVIILLFSWPECWERMKEPNRSSFKKTQNTVNTENSAKRNAEQAEEWYNK